ncbi:conserved hypothetical protein, partial [Trichinella spiralis]|uniref:hypothetical protein n=1 Tax=Trichinella spiralis TaxID=6334 RepID=UPI0001EFE83F
MIRRKLPAKFKHINKRWKKKRKRILQVAGERNEKKSLHPKVGEASCVRQQWWVVKRWSFAWWLKISFESLPLIGGLPQTGCRTPLTERMFLWAWCRGAPSIPDRGLLLRTAPPKRGW